MQKSWTMSKRSQRRLYSQRYSITNYKRRYQQLNCFQHHGPEGLKRDVG